LLGSFGIADHSNSILPKGTIIPPPKVFENHILRGNFEVFNDKYNRKESKSVFSSSPESIHKILFPLLSSSAACPTSTSVNISNILGCVDLFSPIYGEKSNIKKNGEENGLKIKRSNTLLKKSIEKRRKKIEIKNIRKTRNGSDEEEDDEESDDDESDEDSEDSEDSESEETFIDDKEEMMIDEDDEDKIENESQKFDEESTFLKPPNKNIIEKIDPYSSEKLQKINSYFGINPGSRSPSSSSSKSSSLSSTSSSSSSHSQNFNFNLFSQVDSPSHSKLFSKFIIIICYEYIFTFKIA
jgi:hypothetical protein